MGAMKDHGMKVYDELAAAAESLLTNGIRDTWDEPDQHIGGGNWKDDMPFELASNAKIIRRLEAAIQAYKEIA